MHPPPFWTLTNSVSATAPAARVGPSTCGCIQGTQQWGHPDTPQRPWAPASPSSGRPSVTLRPRVPSFPAPVAAARGRAGLRGLPQRPNFLALKRRLCSAPGRAVGCWSSVGAPEGRGIALPLGTGAASAPHFQLFDSSPASCPGNCSCPRQGCAGQDLISSPCALCLSHSRAGMMPGTIPAGGGGHPSVLIGFLGLPCKPEW